MNVPLAIGREEIADYVNSLFIVYTILIVVRVLLSWIPRMPYYRWLSAAVDFVHQVTDPYLNVFRRFIPPIGGGGFRIDITPIIALIVLALARGIIVAAIDPG